MTLKIRKPVLWCDYIKHICSACPDRTSSVLSRYTRGATSREKRRHFGNRASATAGVETILNERILALSASQVSMQPVARTEAASTPIASVRHSLPNHRCQRNLTGCAPSVCLQCGVNRSMTTTIALDEVQPRCRRRPALNQGMSDEVAVAIDPLLNQKLRS